MWHLSVLSLLLFKTQKILHRPQAMGLNMRALLPHLPVVQFLPCPIEKRHRTRYSKAKKTSPTHHCPASKMEVPTVQRPYFTSTIVPLVHNHRQTIYGKYLERWSPGNKETAVEVPEPDTTSALWSTFQSFPGTLKPGKNQTENRLRVSVFLISWPWTSHRCFCPAACGWGLETRNRKPYRFFKVDFISQSTFQVHRKIEREVQSFPLYFLTPTCIASPIIYISNQSGTFVTLDELTLQHHDYPKSIVYFRFHIWLCKFYKVEQMYNDLYPHLQFHNRIVPLH